MDKVILIVEDDVKNMKLFRDLLQANGFSTLEAVDGKQGVEIARSCRPDLILMDVMMPVMNGIDATSLLKSDDRTRLIPIIALTSFALLDEKKRLIEAGCDSYVLKPIRIRPLVDKIRRYLSRKLIPAYDEPGVFTLGSQSVREQRFLQNLYYPCG